jgi:hypothetical protein
MENINEKKYENIYYIIRNFYERFTYKTDKTRQHIIPTQGNIKIKKIYLRNTVFSKENENTVKKMLVIHFYNANLVLNSLETVRLSVCYNDYIDIINKHNIKI